MGGLLRLPQQVRLSAIKTVMDTARKNGLSGMAGECAEVAVAMKRVLFGGKAQIVAGLNIEFEKHNTLVGHFAVRVDDEKYDNLLFDVRGDPFSNEELAAWGQIDPEDSHWSEQAKMLGFTFTEPAALGAIELEFDDCDALRNMPGSGLKAKIELLKMAMIEAGFAYLLDDIHSPRAVRRCP